MTEETPKHVRDMTPEQISEGLQRIKWGSKDGGVTLPRAKPIDLDGFDARTATQEEIDKHARANGISIKKY
jgi:hypothetical protein